MIRIAICDNDVVFCHTLTGILERIFRGKACEIEDFSNGEELLAEVEHMEEGHIFQMIILDVDLPVLDGIMVGHALRNHKFYCEAMLIYISNYHCGAEIITELHPFAYIQKDVPGRILQEKLEVCVEKLRKPVRYIAKSKHNASVINPADILYLESVNRNTIVHMEGRVIGQIPMTLSEVFNELSNLDAFFLQTHKSFVVNSRRITAFGRNEVQLCGELWVPVSYGFRRQLKDAYMELFDTNLS